MAPVVNDLERPIGTHLYGRRMYETMVFWETVSTGTDQPVVIRDFAEIWRAAEKVVYSRSLECHLFLGPIVVGGGKHALPDGLRAQLELLGERQFRNGVVHLRYRVSV